MNQYYYSSNDPFAQCGPTPEQRKKDNMAKHTPGPWITEGWNNLTVNNVGPDKATIVTMVGGGFMATKEELQANARLIAAAPELLEALKEAICTIDTDTPLYKKWQDLIAKAEGQG